MKSENPMTEWVDIDIVHTIKDIGNRVWEQRLQQRIQSH